MKIPIQHLLLFVFFWLYIFTGCASNAQKSSLLLSNPNSVQDTATNLLELDSTTIENIDTISICNIAHSLILLAKDKTVDSSYSVAHQLIDSALITLENAENNSDGCENSTDLLYKIVDLYINSFPKNYLDSIPAHITELVFRDQFSIYSDVGFEQEESSIIPPFECDNGIPYNIKIPRNKRVEKALYTVAVRRARNINTLLERAEYYLPVMKKVFSDYGLPTDLAYLPLLESGFKAKAYSYAHASGIWQFIPSTGRIFGLRNNYWLDERRDPIKATVAAAKYLKKMYDNFNDWHLALAGYNCGERRVSRAMKTANSSDFWDLKLPTQTMNYVPLFIAYQMVGKNPQCFGFERNDRDTLTNDTVKISECLDLRKIASALDTNLSTLKSLNPHIKKWCTPPDMKNVTLYLPKGKVDVFRKYYSTLTDADKVKWFRYRVKSGDNLLAIAGNFKTSVVAIKSINNMRSSRIIAGKYIFIPIPVNAKIPNKKYAKSNLKLVSSEPIEASNFRKRGIKPQKYILKKGDTISELAEIFQVSISDIKRWNNITNVSKLQVGKTLKFYININSKKSDIDIIIDQYPDTTGLIKDVYTVKSGDNFYDISQKLNINMSNLLAWNKKDVNNPMIHPNEKLIFFYDKNGMVSKKTNFDALKKENFADNFVRYKIQSGDNLYDISELFDVELTRLMKINDLTNSSILHSGQIIKIPSKTRRFN